MLADLHVGSPYQGLDRLQNIVNNVNLAAPDLILLLGDFVIQGVVGGNFVSPEDAAQVLSQLKAPLGVFAVLGNHDWWLDPDRVKNALEQQNIPTLEDKSQVISSGNCEINLVGITDFWKGPHDLKQAMAEVKPSDKVLAFTHNPDIFPTLPKEIILTIAGHTHGGQVYLPGICRPIMPSKYGQRYAIGHVIENNSHLYVSLGVGTSILPIRFLVPPEVTILTINNQLTSRLMR